MSVSRPAETDAIEFFLSNPGMYIDPQSQPTQAGNDECWKNLLRRTSVLGHICESMHDGRSHLDATCDGNPYDTCCNVLGRIDEAHREILECNPPRFMTQLPCPKKNRGRLHLCRRQFHGTCGRGSVCRRNGQANEEERRRVPEGGEDGPPD